MADHYEELGVPRDASPGQIKAAYRMMAHRTHPDREGGDAERFKRVSAAYETLSDSERRAQYDRTGQDKPRDLQAEAEDIAAKLILSHVEKSDDPDFVDVLSSVRRDIKAQAYAMRQSSDGVAATIRKLNKAIKRTTRKGGRNLAVLMMEDRVADLERTFEKYKDGLKQAELIQAVLDDYEYAFEPKPTPVWTSATTTLY